MLGSSGDLVDASFEAAVAGLRAGAPDAVATNAVDRHRDTTFGAMVLWLVSARWARTVAGEVKFFIHVTSIHVLPATSAGVDATRAAAVVGIALPATHAAAAARSRAVHAFRSVLFVRNDLSLSWPTVPSVACRMVEAVIMSGSCAESNKNGREFH